MLLTFIKKVAHPRLPSVGFRSWSRFLAVSLQVMWVINPAVGCHYFPPGLQLPPQPLRGLLPICCLVNRGTMGVNSLPKTVRSTWQRRDCDLNPGPSAPESSTLTTRLSSHPLTFILIIISVPTPPHSLIPGIKPSFSANPSNRSLPFPLQDSPDCSPILLSMSVFYFLVFCFTLFSCRFRAVD